MGHLDQQKTFEDFFTIFYGSNGKMAKVTEKHEKKRWQKKKKEGQTLKKKFFFSLVFRLRPMPYFSASPPSSQSSYLPHKAHSATRK